MNRFISAKNEEQRVVEGILRKLGGVLEQNFENAQDLRRYRRELERRVKTQTSKKADCRGTC